jgi:regulator of protease activity HflC (stomatin/prohibitin superfamily)
MTAKPAPMQNQSPVDLHESSEWRKGKPVEDPEKMKRWGFITAKPSEYLIHVRRGKIRRKSTGQGASCFKLPWDSVAVIPTTINRLQFTADQVTLEKVGVQVTGLAVYRIAEPELTFRMLNFSYSERAQEKLGEILTEMFVGATRRLVANLKVEDAITHRKESIARELMAELVPIVEGRGRTDDSTATGWGVVIDTVEIQNVQVLSDVVFKDMQARFRAELALKARMAEMESSREIATLEAAATRQIEEAKIASDTATRELRAQAESRTTQIELSEGAKREQLKARAAEEQRQLAQARALAELKAQTELAEEKRLREQARAVAELKAQTELAEEKRLREQTRALAELKAQSELADEKGAREQARLIGDARAKTQLEQEKAQQAEAIRLAQLAREKKYTEAERALLEARQATAQREAQLAAELALSKAKATAELRDLESAAATKIRERDLQLEKLAGDVKAAVARAAKEVENLVSDDRIRMALVETGLPALAGAFAQKFGEVKITAFGDGADPSAMVARGNGEVLDLARKVGGDLLSRPAAEPASKDSSAS